MQTDWVAFEQVMFPDSIVPIETESLSTSTESLSSAESEEDEVDVSPVQFLRNAKLTGNYLHFTIYTLSIL